MLVPTCPRKGPWAPWPESGRSTKPVRIVWPTGSCSGTLVAKCTNKLFCISWELRWVRPAVVSAARRQRILFALSFPGWRREKVNVLLPGASLVPSAPAKSGTCAGPSLRPCGKRTGSFCGSPPPSSSCGTNARLGYWCGTALRTSTSMSGGASWGRLAELVALVMRLWRRQAESSSSFARRKLGCREAAVGRQCVTEAC